MSDPVSKQVVIGDNNIFAGVGNVIVNNFFSPSDAKERSNRLPLLERVEAFWIETYYKGNLLPGGSRITLEKQTRPESVEHPWDRVIEVPGKEARVLPSDWSMLDIFEKAGRALLILGDPGSGKTMALLELARDLIAQARDNADRPVPVVLNLSTWGKKSESFADWLKRELNSKYYFASSWTEPWLKDNRLLLLLDGLDEIMLDKRGECVKAIYEFIDSYGISGIAVCSRKNDYDKLPEPLRLNGAIYIRPLTLDKVNDYLARAGPELEGVSEYLKSDPVLQEEIRTPLMLGIIVSAYKGMSASDVAGPGQVKNEERRKIIFRDYVEKMFKRRGDSQAPDAKKPYTKEQSIAWLCWLAQRMRQASLSEFQFERMQPDWLPNSLHRWPYSLISRLSVGLIVGAVYGVTLGLIYEMSMGLTSGLWLGAVGGGFAGFVDKVWSEEAHTRVWMSRIPRLLYRIARILIYSLNAVALYWLCELLLMPSWARVLRMTDEGLFWVFLGAGALGIIFGVRDGEPVKSSDIQPIEALGWTWSEAYKGIKPGTVLGLVIGAAWWAYWALLRKQEMRIISWIGDVFICTLGGVVLVMGLRGITGGIVKAKASPNQGIHLSIKNFMLASLTGGAALLILVGVSQWASVGLNQWVILGTTDGFIAGLEYGLIASPVLAPFFGLLFGLIYGGFTVVQHYTLRLLLCLNRYTPVRYVRFLDYADYLILLRKAGGSYIFIHSLLLEYFAELEQGKK